MNIVNHIVIRADEAFLVSRPNLKAEMVARMFVGTGYTLEEVMTHYDLTPAELHACLQYYYDNQAELDARYQVILDEISANAMTLDKFKARLAQHQT